MSQTEGISYKLYSEHLSATGYDKEEVSKILGYVEHQDVRDAVMALMDVVVSGYAHEVVSQICGCCGQCCINRTVLLDAREIGTISRHLDVTERRFRKKYVIPAATWNKQDGALVLKDKKCIFLERGSSGTSKCAIYQVRPQSCREILPEMGRCTRDPWKLLTHVAMLEIDPQAVTCHLTSGSCHQIEQMSPQLQDALRKLDEAVYPHLGKEHNQLNQISGVAHQILDGLISNYKAGVSREILLPRFAAVKEIMEDIETLTTLRETDPQDLELLWSKFKDLSKLCGSGSEADIEKTDSSPEEVPVAICFQPTALSIEMKSKRTTLHYQDQGRLLSLVRTFMEALVTSGEPGLIDVLGHSEPHCILCGVCCGSYDLQATAVDIERLADHLRISEKEVWEKHLEPGVRTWNRRDGFLRRLKKENYDGECVFLKAKSLTESVCGIYEGRPQICREYPASTRLCKKQNLSLKGHELLGYIISCHVADDIVRLTTQHTVSQNKAPLAIALKDNDRLREVFHEVKAEVMQILDNGIMDQNRHMT